MKLVRRLTFLLFVFWGLHLAAVPPLRLAILDTDSGEPLPWETMGHVARQAPPLVMVSLVFPLDMDIPSIFPPPHIPVLLQLELAPGPGWLADQHLLRLGTLLTTFPNVSHLSLKGLERINDFNRLSYVIKKIASLARGIRPGVRIAIACSGWSDEQDLVAITQTLAANPETSPYFDCFFLDTPGKKEIRQLISGNVPHTCFWETVCTPDELEGKGKGFDLPRILSCILENNPFAMPRTSVLVIPTGKADILYLPLVRFSAYLDQHLYKDTTAIKVSYSDGSSSRHPLFFRASDHMPVLFLGGPRVRGEKVMVTLKKGLYKKAVVENLIDGGRVVFKIKRNSTGLVLDLNRDFFSLQLVPRKTRGGDSRYKVDVTGTYRLSAEEIIAGVRAWKARQKSRLRAFTAAVTTSLRLRIGNLRETFDLTIKGPMFAERNKPYDWVWEEFFINGVKWKGKRVPKIPLLQPEKVRIMPLDIDLTEKYRYSLAGETTLEGKRVYIVDFKPRKEFKTTSLYRGRTWIDAGTFAVCREHLIQLNLKGEVISNVETRYFKPVPGAPGVRLPKSVIGHEVFSTAGRITNVERSVKLSHIVINPENFHTLKERAYRSNLLMVRDTQKGFRYLIKDKKSGERTVEWKTKKSQLFGVLGGFYDSSFSYPIPLLGINYMNFNLGGKGRQLNVLFGGVMLTANYSDPSFMGTKMDLGGNLVAVAFPFSNRVYQEGKEIETERLKRLPLRFQLNMGIPLGTYFKLSSFLFFEYNKFSLAKTTGEAFILPRSTLALGWRSRLTANFKGFRLALWGEIARRCQWQSWGEPGNDYFNPNQRLYMRWRVVLTKEFFLSTFRKLHLTAGYFDGFHLDRFSAYKFGFFNELNMHGYMSGVVQAARAFMLNLSYGYSVGRAFRLEVFYDSTWVSNPYSNYRHTYFSGAAVSGTVNIPGLKGILRFEAGMPVVNNGIRGFFLYFIFLKMF
jgi:hypothetical protein